MSMLSSFVDRVRGQGEAAITVPVLDGPLMPNRALDERTVPVFRAAGVDNLVCHGGNLLFSVGAELRQMAPGGAMELVQAYGGEITALAAGAGGTAVAVEGRGIVVHGGAHSRTTIDDLNRWGLQGLLKCVTAMAWLDRDTLAVAVGSSTRAPHEWRRDLLEGGRTGSVLRIDLNAVKGTVLARDLAWPSGAAASADGGVYVSETWRHRVLAIRPGGGIAVVQEDLPAYPHRIAPAGNGGYWLTFLSIRNQLVEFILREPEYRRRMMAEVPEAYWMAPALASGLSFKEPMQQNQLRQMGIMKPWAPTRSYGLVVRCDGDMRPAESFHSRSDGRMHGVTAACDLDGELYVCAKGAGAIVRVEGAAS